MLAVFDNLRNVTVFSVALRLFLAVLWLIALLCMPELTTANGAGLLCHCAGSCGSVASPDALP